MPMNRGDKEMANEPRASEKCMKRMIKFYMISPKG